jgi:hypothetical protein
MTDLTYVTLAVFVILTILLVAVLWDWKESREK